MRKFKALFYPDSIAVVGAHNDPSRLGYTLVKNLKEFGYEGRVYPINPKLADKEMFGYKFYASLLEIPDKIDLAVIAIGARSSLLSLKECAAKGVGSAIVLAAGFSESLTDEGRSMELEMRRISEESGMVIVGPNCLGVLNSSKKICTFAEAEPFKGHGKISIIFQSGSLASSFACLANLRGFYLNKAVSTGNEAAATLNDFLEYLIEDSETQVIAMYIEQVRNGRRFIELCNSTVKPLVAMKIGRSEMGKMAAKSHTAALAGSIEVWNSVCRQVGIIQAETFEELYDFSMALTSPWKPKGGNVGIVTSPGGPSVIAADFCGQQGLAVPQLTNESMDALRKMLPPFASIVNPVDMTMSALEDLNVYSRVVEIVASDRNIDAVLVIAPLKHHFRIAEIVAEVVDKVEKPILVAWTGLLDFDELLKAMSFLGEKDIPNYYMPERAIKAIKVMLNQTQIERAKLNKIAR
jgi:acetyltransferase